MTYHFTDRLQDFEFHDSEWKLLSWEEDELVLSVSYLNVHKTALPEPTDTDMEILDARMTFRGFSLQSYEPSRTWQLDENGNSYTDEPRILHTGNRASESFLAEIKKGVTIFGFLPDNSAYEIGGTGLDPYFTFWFTFRQVEIAWDHFRKAAWYEEGPWKKT